MSFRVVLKNVGRGMVNRDFVVRSSDINEVVSEAFEVVGSILGYDSSIHFNVVGEEIEIKLNDNIVGSLTITKQS